MNQVYGFADCGKKVSLESKLIQWLWNLTPLTTDPHSNPCLAPLAAMTRLLFLEGAPNIPWWWRTLSLSSGAKSGYALYAVHIVHTTPERRRHRPPRRWSYPTPHPRSTIWIGGTTLQKTVCVPPSTIWIGGATLNKTAPPPFFTPGGRAKSCGKCCCIPPRHRVAAPLSLLVFFSPPATLLLSLLPYANTHIHTNTRIPPAGAVTHTALLRRCSVLNL